MDQSQQETPAAQPPIAADANRPEEAVEPMPLPPPVRRKVKQPRARIEWLDGTGPDAKVTNKVMCLRGLAEIAKLLSTGLPKDIQDDDPKLAQRIRITIISDYFDAKRGEAPVETVAIDGPLAAVLAAVYHRLLSPEEISMALSAQFEQFSELSSLKGVLVTMVVEDAKVGGWGFVSNLSDVTDADLVMLAEAAASQANLFKENLKKQRPHLKFPSDAEKSTIIIP